MTPPHKTWRPLLAGAALLAAVLTVPMMQSADAAGRNLLTSPLGPGSTPAAPWHWAGLPAQTKPRTAFTVVDVDGERALRVEAENSYGHLVHVVPADSGGRLLSWTWRLDEAPEQADLRHRETDDAPLKVCALFEHPTDSVPFVERQLLRMARLRAGEMLPAASVCYVWDRKLPAGTTIDNAFTRRVRQIVVRGPDTALRQWYSERRDVVADFQRLFADEIKGPEPLVGVSVAADTDNTHSHSLGWVRALALE